MSYKLKDDVHSLAKELIESVAGIKETAPLFKTVEKSVCNHLKNADSLFFPNAKELERIVQSLCSKFLFHGLRGEAKELQRIYDKLTPDNLSKQDYVNRLNSVKLLLCLSESPTNNFYKYPQKFEKGDVEDVIDWPKYLNEGVARWSPPLDESSSECWSDDSSNSTVEEKDVTDDFDCDLQVQPYRVASDDYHITYRESKENLLSKIQSEWFNYDRVCCAPESDDKNANIALLWDEFVQRKTGGLISIHNSNIVSEYKMMREIIWQFYEPHTSFCFTFKQDALVPKENTTIASVRTVACENFLWEFIPYIEWLQTLREFHESVIGRTNDGNVQPDTYRSYDFAIQTILDPIFKQFKIIEDQIKMQETTTTLLSLADDIRPYFQTIKILIGIHSRVVLNFKENSPLDCAITLLSSLREGLLAVSSKSEQDIYLTLYLHSLYKYFTVINSWLSRDVLEDYTGEFVIADKAQKGQQDWQMQFAVKEIKQADSDPLIAIICTQVLQIGKNIHLLRLLGKLHLVSEATGMYKETFYEAYVAKVLKNISFYFNGAIEPEEALEEEEVMESSSTPTFIFPATCPDECKYLTEMDRLENLVDTDDGFLVKAFETFFIQKPVVDEPASNPTLYEKIGKITSKLFPVQQMLEHEFMEMLNERFSISGMMVKNVLINNYDLMKQFSFLKNIFLFGDDMIFPLYRRIFAQLDLNGMWGNHTWLTSHLQDIIMDTYPSFYKDCSVEVKDSWKLCSDPLKACNMINIHYRISWPVNIIIRDEHMNMYKDMFQFILKIKWALYTLHHLCFTELEPKGRRAKDQHNSLKTLIIKLKILRFGLINIFSNMQHYLLGYIFNKCSYRFAEMLETAFDLESLLKAHADFVQSLHKIYCDLQEFKSTNYGFNLLLYLVRKLRLMWRNMRDINDDELEKCEKWYLLCHKNIDPIINPIG